MRSGTWAAFSRGFPVIGEKVIARGEVEEVGEVPDGRGGVVGDNRRLAVHRRV